MSKKQYLFVNTYTTGQCGSAENTVSEAYKQYVDEHGEDNFEYLTCYEVVEVEVERDVRIVEKTTNVRKACEK